MNNIAYFPAVRLAFDKATKSLDQLIVVSEKESNLEAAKAYREAFSLIREAIKQVENQGHSTIYQHLENDIRDITMVVHESCTKIKEFISEQALLSFEGTKKGIIDVLHKRGYDDTYIENVMKEINKIAEEEVETVFSEEGIDFNVSE